MRHGCTVTVAAGFIAGLFTTGPGFAPTAVLAACDPAISATCAPEPKAAAPLQLKRFLKLGPARRSVSRTAARRVVRKLATKHAAKQAPAPPPKVATTEPGAADTTPLTPKAIPTLSIPVPALALAPAGEDHTVGFTSVTESWSGEGPFDRTDEPEVLPAGVTIARADEVNAIDLAADAKAKTAERAVKTDSLAGVSLITPANAGTPAQPPAAHSVPQTSWLPWALSWAYSKLVDGVLTVLLAIRSLFV